MEGYEPAGEILKRLSTENCLEEFRKISQFAKGLFDISPPLAELYTHQLIQEVFDVTLTRNYFLSEEVQLLTLLNSLNTKILNFIGEKL